MNNLPDAFAQRMKMLMANEAEAFFNALQKTPPVSIRLNPGKPYTVSHLFTGTLQPVEWCEQAFYIGERPLFTLDPGLHGGAYYVQEASSMFLQYILKQIKTGRPVRILDLCAAPGGKSTLIASMLSDADLLVSNEVIRTRASILRENMIKWGQGNMVITNNDPADFSCLEGAFDILVVDAPCSGEGMFRKDPGSISQWNENNLQLCSERQQRILSDIWKCLKPGGFLIYSTCTYNPQENEAILEWLRKEKEALPVNIEHSFSGITPGYSDIPCYRFYPHKIPGEGFFTGVMQKTDGPEFTTRKLKKVSTQQPQKLARELEKYICQPEKYIPYINNEVTGIIPAAHADFIRQLNSTLRVIYQGCELAEANNRKLKLLPSLALWQGLNMASCNLYAVDRSTALTYLKKEDIPVPPTPGNWVLISYNGINLGWCKHLGNRLNNYFPKEWRIRMQIDTETNKE